MENSKEFPQKIKNGATINLAILFLGISAKKIKTLIRKEYALQCSQQHCSQ